MPSRILVIEDNRENLELMTYLLSAFGHVPLTATDGEAGLALARSERPDMVVCDIQLPGLDGYAVARAIRADETLKGTVLVAVSALAMASDRERGLAAGFDLYVSKPIDPEAFVPSVERFLPPGQRSIRHEGVSQDPAPVLQPPRATLLLVDDVPSNLELGRSVFEPAGYAVVTADSMAHALELISRTPPDLILSDVNMADGSGFDFLRRLKTDPRLQAIPFLFITSTAWDSAARHQALALGAERYLFRPIEPQTLLLEIEACLPAKGGK